MKKPAKGFVPASPKAYGTTSSDLRIVERDPASDAPPLLLGESSAMEHLRTDIRSAARCDAKVLITGETGTGKEIVARLIHLQGARAKQPFLDELGEMSPRMQGVLLRFLETGEIHRLGADRIEQKVNVRVIAATNRNLRERVASGDFREDLYYRLNVAHVFVPPLRDRGQDIALLFRHYFDRYCHAQGISTPALSSPVSELLLAYAWPGNVREL